MKSHTEDPISITDDAEVRAISKRFIARNRKAYVELSQNAPADSDPKTAPNAETRAALAEYDEMKTHPEKYKRYHSFAEVLEDVEKSLMKPMLMQSVIPPDFPKKKFSARLCPPTSWKRCRPLMT